MISRHILGAAALLAGLDLTRSEQDQVPEGPGRQLRDERERAGASLRHLVAHTHMSTVELIERGILVPTPEQWALLQAALPGLGPMAPIHVPRVRELLDAKERRLDAALHPTGRCTCAGAGTCEWCVMDQRREKREARRPGRCTCTPDTSCSACYQRGYADAHPEEREAERARKAKLRQARAKRKARRGW